MYLGPHEFQAQARYFEDAVHFAAAALWFQCYGLIGSTLDGDALRNGTVSLVHASGIFPDGTPFHMPQSDAVPAVRPIADLFPPTRDTLTVFLGIRERKTGGRNCAIGGDPGDSRYFAELRTFNDETSGGDSRPVPIRRKNVRILLESELTDNTVALPLARLRRDGSGHFIYDPLFVPPCLQITASERLMLMLRRLIEILESKSSALSRTSSGERRSGRILLSRPGQLLADARRQFGPGGAAPSVDFEARPSGAAFYGNVAPGRGALYLRARVPSAHDADLRSPQPGRLLRETRRAHPHASGDHRSHQLRLHSSSPRWRITSMRARSAIRACWAGPAGCWESTPPWARPNSSSAFRNWLSFVPPNS